MDSELDLVLMNELHFSFTYFTSTRASDRRSPAVQSEAL